MPNYTLVNTVRHNGHVRQNESQFCTLVGVVIAKKRRITFIKFTESVCIIQVRPVVGTIKLIMLLAC